MPLHLLGKKSWNVYNKDSIERVRRDEEKARKEQHREELEQRDKDAASRLRKLRGDDSGEEPSGHADEPRGHKRKHEDYEGRDISTADHNTKRRDRDDVHASSWRSPTITTDPLDQISNMRFRDAAGRNVQTPWYSASRADAQNEIAPVGRDVWGNEDKSRHARDQKRLDSSDPLLAMKRGVQTLRSVERTRAEWREEREKDLNEVEELARRERHRRRRKERHRDRERSRSIAETAIERQDKSKKHPSERSRHERREKAG